jgi:hypothetical protein
MLNRDVGLDLRSTIRLETPVLTRCEVNMTMKAPYKKALAPDC